MLKLNKMLIRVAIDTDDALVTTPLSGTAC